MFENPILLKKRKQAQILGLKRKLSNTDYKAIKYAEGWLTDEEYSTVKSERQALRDRINALEIEVKELEIVIEEQEKLQEQQNEEEFSYFEGEV
jgi:hypothetical protein